MARRTRKTAISREETKKLAIVGNSFTGALAKALGLALVETKGFEISFVVSAGKNFSNINVKNGQFINSLRTNKLSSSQSVDKYDAFFIYGRLPNPYQVYQLYKLLFKRGFSSQFINVTLQDYVCESDTYRVYQTIQQTTTAPIFLLSGNVASNTTVIGRERYSKGVRILTNILGNRYHEFPYELFTAEWAPRMELYKNSVNKRGERAKSELGHKQDIFHMNEIGGAIVLESIVGRARQSWDS